MQIVDNLKIIRLPDSKEEHGIGVNYALQVKGAKDYIYTSMFYRGKLTDNEISIKIMKLFCNSMRTDSGFYEKKILEQLEKRLLLK